VVIKPAVSATAWRTELIDAKEAGTYEVDVLVQPYMKEIEQGEWSLIFFGGEFSHAVFKRPKRGDFRVQSDFGGTATARMPDAKLIEQARKHVKKEWLYARVDGIEQDGRFLLMELELTEPALFFHTDPAAPGRFVDALELHGCP
jgi:glutathione synthase/RimK-type ligase-like ATP-grasp enzyme